MGFALPHGFYLRALRYHLRNISLEHGFFFCHSCLCELWFLVQQAFQSLQLDVDIVFHGEKFENLRDASKDFLTSPALDTLGVRWEDESALYTNLSICYFQTTMERRVGLRIGPESHGKPRK